jgi:hypothetical protein
MKKIFLDWLSGKPLKKKSIVRNLFGKFIVGTMWIYVVHSFSSGPGALLASINPIGFKTIYCNGNSIHYTKDFNGSIDYYFTLVKEANGIVKAKWNEGDAVRPERKSMYHVYLTSRAQNVAKLTMVNTAAVTVFGNKIVVSTEFINKMGWDFESVLKHEMSHIECTSRYGWMNGYFHFPVWLDEGIASNFSNFSQSSEKHFIELLSKNHEVVSLTKLNTIFSWQSALFTNHDTFEKQYGYSRWIAKDLMGTYGMNALKEYLSGKTSFAAVFGMTLEEYENNWVETNKRNSLLPNGVNLIYPSASWKVIGLWTLQTAVIAAFFSYLLLWTVRQVMKLFRAVRQKSQDNRFLFYFDFLHIYY